MNRSRQWKHSLRQFSIIILRLLVAVWFFWIQGCPARISYLRCWNFCARASACYGAGDKFWKFRFLHNNIPNWSSFGKGFTPLKTPFWRFSWNFDKTTLHIFPNFHYIRWTPFFISNKHIQSSLFQCSAPAKPFLSYQRDNLSIKNYFLLQFRSFNWFIVVGVVTVGVEELAQAWRLKCTKTSSIYVYARSFSTGWLLFFRWKGGRWETRCKNKADEERSAAWTNKLVSMGVG